jgi:hypothetical protein
MAGASRYLQGGGPLAECGLTRFDYNLWRKESPDRMHGDDDRDGLFDERDERDMMFTWMSDFFTTRANVFTVDLDARLCEPPYYPEIGRVPLAACKSSRTYARRQFRAILDRSVCLRLKSKGGGEYECDFTGPVEVRMMRPADEARSIY